MGDVARKVEINCEKCFNNLNKLYKWGIGDHEWRGNNERLLLGVFDCEISPTNLISEDIFAWLIENMIRL